MEQIKEENNPETVVVNATDIIAKYKNRLSRQNFCLEKNWYHPEELGYESTFFLRVLMGEKKYLSLGILVLIIT